MCFGFKRLLTFSAVLTILVTLTFALTSSIQSGWRTFGGGTSEIWAFNLMASCLDRILIGIGRTANEGSANAFVADTDGITNLLEDNTLTLVNQPSPIKLGSLIYPYYAYYIIPWKTPFAAPTTIDFTIFGTGAGGQVYYDVPVNNCQLAQVYSAMPSWESPFGSSKLSFPSAVATDNTGNVFVLDSSRVQKFDANGNFLLQWGQNGSGDGHFSGGGDLDVDSAGNVYVVDAGNNRVQKFDNNGNYLLQWNSWDPGDGNTSFSAASAIAIDNNDNIYVGDQLRSEVIVFNTSGGYLRQIGDISSYGTAPGEFQSISAIGISPIDNSVFVGDYSRYDVQKFDSSGTYITEWGSNGSGNGQFSLINDIDVDAAGNVFVTDGTADRVQRFDSSGVYQSQFGGTGTSNGQFDSLQALAVGPGNIFYVADGGNARIQKFTGTGTYHSQWGQFGTSPGQFGDPTGIDTTASGTTFVADQLNNRIQKFDRYGTFLLEWGSYGSGDGQFNNPAGLALNSSNQVYVADESNNRIQYFDENGVFLGKWGSPGSGSGQFNQPCAIAVDPSGSVFVVDRNNHRVQKFDASGNYLGQFGTRGSSSGQFSSPCGIVVDTSGNIFVSDTDNHRIQVFDATMTYLTQWGTYGSGNGQFNQPMGLALDELGNLYVVDSGNHRIQKFNSTHAFVTQVNRLGMIDAFNNTHLFNQPSDVALDSAGIWYVTDTQHDRVAIIQNLLAPIAADDVYAMTVNTPLTVNAPGVLSNDSDYFGDALLAAVMRQPSHGSVTLNPDGSFTYTPNNDFVGTDSFTYAVVDGSSFTTNIATVTLTIPNPAPLAVDDNYNTPFNTPLIVNAPGVLSNDTDANNDPLSLALVTNTQHGILALNADGSFVYTPNWFYIGSDTFTYKLNDGLSDSTVATVTITVPPPIPASDLVLTAPTGNIVTSSGNPTYIWLAVENATAYSLYLAPADNLPVARFFGTLNADEICLNNICSVDLTERNPSAWLSNGQYAMFMTSTDWATYAGPFEFTIDSPQPSTITPGETTGTVGTLKPTLNWSLEGSASYTAFYQLYIAPTDDLGNPVLFGWVARNQVCGSWSGTSCALSLFSDLQNKTHYTAYIQSWGPGGVSTGGLLDGWAVITFNMGGPIPNVPSGIQVNSANPPTITWSDDPLATSFIIWVGDIDQPNTWPGSVSPISKTGSGISCDGATCSYTVPDALMPGSYSIYMQAQGENGHSRGGLGGAADGWVEGPGFKIP